MLLRLSMLDDLKERADTLGSQTFPFQLMDGIEGIFDAYNQRIKLYQLDASAFQRDEVCAELIRSAGKDLFFTKLSAYAYEGEDELWRELGFQKEAVIQGFYPDHQDAHLWCYYPGSERACDADFVKHQEGVEIASQRSPVTPGLPEGYSCQVVSADNIDSVVALLEKTFDDYPSPLDRSTIASNIKKKTHHYRAIFDEEGNILAVASAEIDHQRSSVELTDCATAGQARGKGLMTYILAVLENDMMELYGIVDLYTIARAVEVGMNCAFAKLGYHFTGTLINNCRMPQGWESMNVWCKRAGGA